MYDPSEFTEKRGTLRGSFKTYKRNGSGGMDILMTVEPDDRHEALDIIDGGDFVNLIHVYGMPEDDHEFPE